MPPAPVVSTEGLKHIRVPPGPGCTAVMEVPFVGGLKSAQSLVFALLARPLAQNVDADADVAFRIMRSFLDALHRLIDGILVYRRSPDRCRAPPVLDEIEQTLGSEFRDLGFVESADRLLDWLREFPHACACGQFR